MTHNRLETAGVKPTSAEIEVAEIAINLEDKKLWTKDHNGDVVSLGEDIGDFITETPVLSGLGTVVESTDLIVTISNYDANATYFIATSSGTMTRVGATITITAGGVAADEPGHTLTVGAARDGFLVSPNAVHGFTVTNRVEQEADYVINPNGAGWNTTNFPSVVNGNVTNNYLEATAGDCVATALQYDKVDNPTYTWSGTVGTSDYVESELVNRLASADATDMIVNDQVSNGDVLYIGDGTDEAELVAGSSITALATTLDPATKGTNTTLSADNLTFSITGVTDPEINVYSIIKTTTGKVQVEMTVTSGNLGFGVSLSNTFQSNVFGVSADHYSYRYIGQIYHNGSVSAYGQAYTAGDIIGCTFNTADGELEFFKNGVSQGIATTLGAVSVYFAMGNKDLLNATINFGATAFAHPVSGAIGLGVASKLAHNQAFTPTYTCSQDNVSVPISFNAGVNYKTASKLSGTYTDTVADGVTVKHKEYLDTMTVDVAQQGSELIYKVEAKEEGTEVLEANISLMEAL